MSTLSRLPLVKGGRGMFHRTCDAMRTEHPPSPLRKGEVYIYAFTRVCFHIRHTYQPQWVKANTNEMTKRVLSESQPAVC